MFGLLGLLYFSFPFISWQLYFSAFASEGVLSPVPHEEPSESLTAQPVTPMQQELSGIDYTDAQNWFPLAEKDTSPSAVSSYLLTIPKIQVTDAVVSTVDTNLTNHMVQYGSKVTPPETGTAVVFGHSTLPQLYNPKDYKTILAKAYMLKKGDSLIVTVNGVAYTYTIFNIRVVDAEDTSVFMQRVDNSYLTIVTCTPPGTVWKRLVLTARIQPL